MVPVDSIERLLHDTGEKTASGQHFERESERMLRIEVDGGVWLKPGAAIAYRGQLKFERRHTLAARSLIDAAIREASPLVRASGTGRLYCAHRGLHVRPLRLSGETIVVAWPELLAFEESLTFQARLVANHIGIAAGGLIVVELSGHGSLAIGSHGEPLTLSVTPDTPLSTDPHATLAWSGGLTPALKTDLSWRSVLRHGGGEPVQMRFEGTGFVAVQPYQDGSRFVVKVNPLARLKALLAG
jgi:uncharacterized protein (AIM24 family)